MAIRYSRQVIDSSDVKNVVKTLTSDWLTTGPNIEKFEKDICKHVNSEIMELLPCHSTLSTHCV